MDLTDLDSLQYNLLVMVLALGVDSLLGDPVYALHPVRLMGKAIARVEKSLFEKGWNNKSGGVFLCLFICTIFVVLYVAVAHLLGGVSQHLALLFDIAMAFHMLALKDLILHSERIARAIEHGNLEGARFHCSRLAGRDTDKMDSKACNRCAVESVSESLVDGVLSPLFFFWRRVW